MASKKPKHVYKTHYKVITNMNQETLEKQIDAFSEEHEVVSVNVSISNLDQKGLMLCDRIDPNVQIAWMFVATIGYKADLTQEQVDKAMGDWIVRKVQEHYGDLSKHPNAFIDVATGGLRTKREIVKAYADSLCNSPEYKQVAAAYEKQFSVKTIKRKEGSCEND